MTLETGVSNLEPPNARTSAAPQTAIRKGGRVRYRHDGSTPQWMVSLEHRYWKLHNKIYSYDEKPSNLPRQQIKMDTLSGRGKVYCIKKTRSVDKWQRLPFDKNANKCQEILTIDKICTKGPPSTRATRSDETTDEFSVIKRESNSCFEKSETASSSLRDAMKTQRLTVSNASSDKNFSCSTQSPTHYSEANRSIKQKHFGNFSCNCKAIAPVDGRYSFSCHVIRAASDPKPPVLSCMSSHEAKRAIVDIETAKECDSSTDTVPVPNQIIRIEANERCGDNAKCEVRTVDETCQSKVFGHFRCQDKERNIENNLHSKPHFSARTCVQNDPQQPNHIVGSELSQGEYLGNYLPSTNDSASKICMTCPTRDRTFEITAKDYDSRFHKTTANSGLELADVHDKAFIKCMNWLNKYNPKPEFDTNETVKIATVVL